MRIEAESGCRAGRKLAVDTGAALDARTHLLQLNRLAILPYPAFELARPFLRPTMDVASQDFITLLET